MGPAATRQLAAKIATAREQRQVQAAILEQLTASGESKVSLNAPDARALVAGQETTVGYKTQVAVDAKDKLIVEQRVTNAATDMGLLAVTAGAARETLGVGHIDAVADIGYYKGVDIEACEANGVTPYVARPERGSAVASGRFPKERCAYDPEADAYRCPGGQLLDARYRSVANGHVSVPYSTPRRLCRLSDQATLHRKPLAAHQALGERGGARALGEAARGLARYPQRPPRDGRVSVRLDQAVDEP